MFIGLGIKSSHFVPKTKSLFENIQISLTIIADIFQTLLPLSTKDFASSAPCALALQST
jgi:hypothetical protein